VDGLIEALGYQDDHNVRLAAATALGRMGDSRAAKPLVNLLEDKSENVRWYASQALEAITGDSFGEDITQWEHTVSQSN